MTQKVQELIINIWKTEKMSNEWNKSIICPIYKERNLNIPVIEKSHSLIPLIRP